MSTAWRKRTVALFAAGALALLGAACQTDDGGGTDDTQQPTDTGTVDDTLEGDTGTEGDA